MHACASIHSLKNSVCIHVYVHIKLPNDVDLSLRHDIAVKNALYSILCI